MSILSLSIKIMKIGSCLKHTNFEKLSPLPKNAIISMRNRI